MTSRGNLKKRREVLQCTYFDYWQYFAQSDPKVVSHHAKICENFSKYFLKATAKN